MLGLISFLIILQPDIGTLFIIAFISLVVYFIGGGRISHILGIIIICSLMLVAMVYSREYQMNRFKCLIDPNYDIYKTCYQIRQSLIAVGSGGLWGKGIGQSRQKFMYLPEVSGDSIFAIIAEEIGLIFSSCLIFMYFFLFWRGCKIAKYSPDVFGRILAVGIVTWILIQAILNIAGIINLIPMTGVPLPFISYGGSAILSSLAAMGILVNISKYTTKKI